MMGVDNAMGMMEGVCVSQVLAESVKGGKW